MNAQAKQSKKAFNKMYWLKPVIKIASAIIDITVIISICLQYQRMPYYHGFSDLVLQSPSQLAT